MKATSETAESATKGDRPAVTQKPEQIPSAPRKTNGLSMHADIPVWYDCCSCEAEPYWLEAMDANMDNDKDKDR